MAHSTPLNLNASTLVSEKQNNKITMENKKKLKITKIKIGQVNQHKNN
jgi:hypothetical protein